MSLGPLQRPTSEFNVDPNAPFLGGGVNLSSYGPEEPQSPPSRPTNQFKRFASLRRFMLNNRLRQPAPDLEDGLSDTSIGSPAPLPIPPPGSQPGNYPAIYARPVTETPSSVGYNTVLPSPSPSFEPPTRPTTVLENEQFQRSPAPPVPIETRPGAIPGDQIRYAHMSPSSSASDPDTIRIGAEEIVPDGDTTLVGHDFQQPPYGQDPNGAEVPAVPYAPEYANMEPPKHRHHGDKPSRMQQFWETINNMPWVSRDGRITIDYTPRRAKRPDVPYQSSTQVQPIAWYNESLGSPGDPDMSVTPFPPPNDGMPIPADYGQHYEGAPGEPVTIPVEMEYRPSTQRGMLFPSQAARFPGGYSMYQPPGDPLVPRDTYESVSGSSTETPLPSHSPPPMVQYDYQTVYPYPVPR